jgi:LPS sulfotransferase NodH
VREARDGQTRRVRWVVEPLPIPDDPPAATRSLLLCGTPRCGSWLLADLLEQTGVAGRPHEWFWRDTVAAHTAAWGTTTDEEYLRGVLAVGTTPNGVFAAKVMWTVFSDELVERLPPAVFVWLRREDEVAQAVSFWRAVESGRWHAWDGPGGRAHFDRGAIAHLLAEIREQNGSWAAWFAAHGVAPLELWYERLADDPDGEARRVLELLGVDGPELQLVPRVERVGDRLNADWAARFRAVP